MNNNYWKSQTRFRNKNQLLVITQIIVMCNFCKKLCHRDIVCYKKMQHFAKLLDYFQESGDER